METKTTHIGGYMYGDGEYVVEFENVRSEQAPTSALILSPEPHGAHLTAYSCPLPEDVKPNVATARRLIALARAKDRRNRVG